MTAPVSVCLSLGPYAAIFVVNAAIMASKRQHHARVNCFFAPICQRRARGWTVFQVFGMTLSGIEPTLPAVVRRAQPSVQICRVIFVYLKLNHALCPRLSSVICSIWWAKIFNK